MGLDPGKLGSTDFGCWSMEGLMAFPIQQPTRIGSDTIIFKDVDTNFN
jgi:hypothetical protein